MWLLNTKFIIVPNSSAHSDAAFLSHCATQLTSPGQQLRLFRLWVLSGFMSLRIQEHFTFLWWGLNSFGKPGFRQSHLCREWRKLFKALRPLYCQNHEKYPHFTTLNYVYHFPLLWHVHKSASFSSQAKAQPLLPPSVCPDVFRFPIQLLNLPCRCLAKNTTCKPYVNTSILSFPNLCLPERLWLMNFFILTNALYVQKLLPENHSFKIQFLKLFLLPVSVSGDD